MHGLALSGTLLFFLSLFSMYLGAAETSILAVIDSGTDVKHPALQDKLWHNPGEIFGDDDDNDGNGLRDDYFGWNFAENNEHLIDYQYLSYVDAEVKKFFAIQAQALMGNVTEEDLAWLKAKISDKEFLQRLQICGNFIHGTHVSGIATKDTTGVQLLSVKLLPTEAKLPFDMVEKIRAEKGIGLELFKLALSYLASKQAEAMLPIFSYVAVNGASVANGSFGVGVAQTRPIIEMLYRMVFFWRADRDNTAEIDELNNSFIFSILKHQKKILQLFPKTLFVFAAGNDGTDNDVSPSAPANIRGSNVLAVGAVDDQQLMARFSNYGAKTVDLFAPGVNILSSIPGDQYLRISGTSQAAPHVANVAAQIKTINPNLHPEQIKKILLATVDRKPWLLDKSVSGGVLNKQRALLAALSSLENNLDRAVALAWEQQPVTIQSDDQKLRGESLPLPIVGPLPGLFTTPGQEPHEGKQ